MGVDIWVSPKGLWTYPTHYTERRVSEKRECEYSIQFCCPNPEAAKSETCLLAVDYDTDLHYLLHSLRILVSEDLSAEF
ncbi:conserved hypothetical protein [Ricinus communis]|uniref:Uncharacterized protein n=1 Tax=Ricinus communis TaxID=3988 RepID=B9SCD9_RICCO|nr:conserved hypothetical protein [Ricinus communis]